MSQNNSHKQILKSTGIIGGTQIIAIAVGMVRTKVLALLLGPTGVGTAGLYQTVVDTIRIATGLGIPFSSVREIAQAVASGNHRKFSVSVKVVTQWLWITGLLGTVLALAFCVPISRYTFGDEKHAVGIAVLSITILTASASAGQLAVLQGVRRIGDMAKANIIGVFTSTIVALPVYWWLGINGIVPAMLLTAFLTLGISWYYARNVNVAPVRMHFKRIYRRGTSMVKLGLFTVFTNVINLLVLYLVRAFVVKQEGLEALGQFVAAWTISSLYLSAILNSMGTDYYPRLSTVQHDDRVMNKLVNEQMEIALLVACPVITAMVAFISIIVQLFYSKAFVTAGYVLSWQLLGDFFKVLAWPIGYTFIAKAKGRVYGLTDVFWSVVYLLIVYLGWKTFGLEITGIAFTASFFLYLLLVFWVAKRSFGFRLSRGVVRAIIFYLPLLIGAFLCSRYLSRPYNLVAGVVFSGLAGAFSFWQLSRLIDFKGIIQKFTRKKNALPLADVENSGNVTQATDATDSRG